MRFINCAILYYLISESRVEYCTLPDVWTFMVSNEQVKIFKFDQAHFVNINGFATVPISFCFNTRVL